MSIITNHNSNANNIQHVTQSAILLIFLLTNLISSLPLKWNLPVRNTGQFLDNVTSPVTHTTNNMLSKQKLISLGLHLLQGVSHFLQPWSIWCCHKAVFVFSSFFFSFITTFTLNIVFCKIILFYWMDSVATAMQVQKYIIIK